MFLGKSKSPRQESNLGFARKWDAGLEAISDERYDPMDIHRKEWEFCGEEAGQTIVKGRLRENIQYWEDIGCNETILQVIREGYRIPFLTTPPSTFLKNNRSAVEHSSFVTKAIQELLDTGRIKEVETPPVVVNPLSVSSKNGKERLILDLRHVNKHVYKQKIKFDDWKVMEQFLKEGGYVFSFDIKQGYHHVDMHPESIPYLGFSWEINGVTRYFVFLVLPFGLTSAPFIFTKLVRVLVKMWRGQGVRICVFIDDGLGAKGNYPIAKMDANLVRHSLECSGFVANVEKSHWEPSQELTWLGFTVNLALGTIRTSEERVKSLVSALSYVSQKLPFTSARKLANLTGKIMSTKWVLGDITHLKTRHLYRVIDSRRTWDKTISLNQHWQAIREIIYWKNNFKSLNVRRLNSHTVPTVTVASDASAYGLGAHTYVDSKEVIVHKSFSPEEINTSSTYREVFAILYALSALKHIHKGQTILWYTDNFAASKIIRKGSPKVELHEMAEKVFNLCKKYDILI